MHPRTYQLINTLVVASLLSGCALGPNHRPIAVETPTRFRGDKKEQSLESLADLEWWKVFKDKSLQELIREALRNNYDLRIAITRIEQARARKMQTASAFYPQVGYQIAAERNQAPGTYVPATTVPDSTINVGGTDVVIPGRSTPEQRLRSSPTNSFTAVGNAAWEIDLWGRIRRSNEASLAQLLASEEVRHGVVQSLVSEVAITYFQLLEADEELKIARRTMESFGQSLELFTKQQRGGIASDLEVARGTASQANAAASIPRIERQISAIENQLCVLLGRLPGPIKRDGSLLSQKMPPSVPSGIPSDLLTRRPDIRQAEQMVISANAMVGVAIADFFPVFDLTAAAGAISPKLNDITSGTWNVWSIGGALNGPIFQGGRYVGRYREAKALFEEARLQYMKAANSAFSEVSDALIARQKFALSRVEQEKQVEALQKSVRISMDRYTIGVTTYYEVLEAQQQLFPAELLLAQTRYQQLAAVVDLYSSLGGGWAKTSLTVAKEGVVVQETKEVAANTRKASAAEKANRSRKAPNR